MPNDTPVPPALTDAEWASFLSPLWDEALDHRACRDVCDTLVAHDSGELQGFTPTPGGIHYAIAVLNAALPHDHPGKITPEDVALLRRLANDPIALSVADHGLDDALRTVAGKLAALLPP